MATMMILIPMICLIYQIHRMRKEAKGREEKKRFMYKKKKKMKKKK